MTEEELDRALRLHGWVTHTYHDDVHELGLQRDCPRCEDLALHPDQLDDDVQTRLLRGRTLTPLDVIAAKRLREASPHRFVYGELVPSLCVLCGEPLNYRLHEAMP